MYRLDRDAQAWDAYSRSGVDPYVYFKGPSHGCRVFERKHLCIRLALTEARATI